MGNATASQIEPITAALIGILAAAALVAVAIATARHFLRKGEDASAPSGFYGRAAHIIGYIFAAALIAGAGASIATYVSSTGADASLQSAASRTGSGTNPFAPTESSGLEPLQGKRSELGNFADAIVDAAVDQITGANRTAENSEEG